MNVVLPGAGLFMLGRRKQGVVMAGLFLACFFAALGLFLVAYARYLSLAMSDDLLKGDTLERAGEVFPRAWLVGLAVVAGIIHLVSMAMLRAARRRASAK